MTKTIARQLNIKELPFSIKDKQGREIYWENSVKEWYKQEYDEHGNITYYENGSGFWYKVEYDESVNRIYYENSDGVKSNDPLKLSLDIKLVENDDNNRPEQYWNC